LQARKTVCEYLTGEGFDTQLRFSGCCDYFVVGGRWSGRLRLLRLRYEQPKRFEKFWKRFVGTDSNEDPVALFRELFPAYRGPRPICRKRMGDYGRADDAQIMDESLFQQLKAGFSESVSYAYEITEPNVIFTEDTDDFEWPKTSEEAAKFWVVVIDYHF
jgi:hypothetical protein